ncbi:hypothetical protein CKY39_12415 [Variovorax boronicumulans]|uniref:Uncharacterized protein n=1 Tax=Variovorax boronicumulans TaxID=436515 RepID=A0A250DI40_9BURK|nr:hypothetical protein [Variovorax boronicumulans]ATA53934.1 hypothetical protein CKY39_12415 [Variovorax boronicumulans]
MSQLLSLLGHDADSAQSLEAIPQVLRDQVAADVVCPSCGVGGAKMVQAGRNRKTGSPVSQAHFRFQSNAGGNAHDPLCDFYDDRAGNKGGDHLIDFRSARSELTRLVGRLVCRGIALELFSQQTMRDMRQWFLGVRRANQVLILDVAEKVEWCTRVIALRGVGSGDVAFQPAFAEMPNFNWKAEARRRVEGWHQASFNLIHGHFGAFFAKGSLSRIQALARIYEGVPFFDVRVLADKYQATIALARFMCSQLDLDRSLWVDLHRYKTPAPSVAAMVAFSALLLYISEWDPAKAAELFVRIAVSDWPFDPLAGNLIGLNPFHDFLAWEAIMIASEVCMLRISEESMDSLLLRAEAELRQEHEAWLRVTGGFR